MRYLMTVKSGAGSARGRPGRELIAVMRRFTEDMVKAGVMLAAEGLHPTSKGARIQVSAQGPTVAHGPFGDPSDRIAGFWLIEVKSKEEAIEWARRCPDPGAEKDVEIELREVFDLFELPLML